MKLTTVRARDFLQRARKTAAWLDTLGPVMQMSLFGPEDGVYYTVLLTPAGKDKMPFMLRFAADAIEKAEWEIS